MLQGSQASCDACSIRWMLLRGLRNDCVERGTGPALIE